FLAGIQAAMANTSRNRRSLQNIGNIAELLRVYSKWAYQSLILQSAISTYLSLRGGLSDQLVDLNFSRTRLNELKQSFAPPDPAVVIEKEPIDERLVLPEGDQTVSVASARLLQSIGGPELETLDGLMQEMIQRQFTSFAHVCLTTANLPRDLQ